GGAEIVAGLGRGGGGEEEGGVGVLAEALEDPHVGAFALGEEGVGGGRVAGAAGAFGAGEVELGPGEDRLRILGIGKTVEDRGGGGEGGVGGLGDALAEGAPGGRDPEGHGRVAVGASFDLAEPLLGV